MNLRRLAVGIVLASLAVSVEAQRVEELTTLDLPGFDSLVTIDRDFVKNARAMGELAEELGITILVQQSFRKKDQRLADPIVEPSALSNHLIGQAFDVNLELDGVRYSSKELRRKDSLPVEIKDFIDGCKALGLHWGGDFKGKGFDPVHFASGLNVKDPKSYLAKYKVFQKQRASAEDMLVDTIDACIGN